MSDDLSPLPDAVGDTYSTHAEDFDRERTKTLFERPWLDRFAALLPPGGTILDLGCGTGEPISRALIERGFALTGIDIAPPMVAIAQARFPDHRWAVGDIRTLSLGHDFDGIIGWHSLFHLSADAQRSALPRIADHLRPGGALLLTVAPMAGETVGWIAGQPVYHAGLDEDDYRDALRRSEINLISFVRNDPTCHGATIVLGQKRA